MEVREVPPEFEERHERWLAEHENCPPNTGESDESCSCGPEPCRRCGGSSVEVSSMALCGECSANKVAFVVELSEHEAVVLFEFVARFGDSDVLDIKDKAEEVLLWGIEGSFESILVEPFASDYKSLLNKAREAVRGEH